MNPLEYCKAIKEMRRMLLILLIPYPREDKK